jgi:hypothetical protein
VSRGSASGERVVMSASMNGADAPAPDIVPCQDLSREQSRRMIPHQEEA